ncbi:MAG TPA: GDP-mannose 4,6-dehydratase, partial [Bacteroidia bacterium]|nr:GDP-mannose 4,6-dehydratase [Bacteroidia bacterium]
WGHAKDYVEGMWMMMQIDIPDDFVLATGKKISVRRFVELAFHEVGITMEWKGKGIEEKGINKATGDVIVEIDPRYFRPTEVDLLIGDASKAFKKFGWKPKLTIEDLVKEMVASDVKLFEKDKYLMDGGHEVLKFNE